MIGPSDHYEPDRSLRGKLRRRLVRLAHRRPARVSLERPMISFTFDDAPASAATRGAALLEATGARGTYYLAGGLVGRASPMGRLANAQEIQSLAERGHEIACHTFSHLDCGQADAAAASADADRNAAALAELGSAAAPTNFAYPYGDVCAEAKGALAGRYSVLRALHHGLIADGADLNQAPAVGIEGPDGEATARRWLQQAARRRGWLILYTHDVSDEPTQFGCSPAALERLIGEAKAAGFDIVTVAEGARRIGA